MGSDKDTTLADLRARIAQFVDERDWQQFHDPKNLAMSIAIEAAELMEHFQWLRSDQIEAFLSDEQKLGEVREELADILAYVLSLANRLQIDTSKALLDKMEKNAQKYPAEKYRGRFR